MIMIHRQKLIMFIIFNSKKEHIWDIFPNLSLILIYFNNSLKNISSVLKQISLHAKLNKIGCKNLSLSESKILFNTIHFDPNWWNHQELIIFHLVKIKSNWLKKAHQTMPMSFLFTFYNFWIVKNCHHL